MEYKYNTTKATCTEDRYAINKIDRERGRKRRNEKEKEREKYIERLKDSKTERVGFEREKERKGERC